MKKIVAMLLVVALAVAVAAYIAFAPHARFTAVGPLRDTLATLDTSAMRLVLQVGMNAAIAIPLGIGALAALVIALLPRRHAADEPARLWSPEPEEHSSETLYAQDEEAGIEPSRPKPDDEPLELGESFALDFDDPGSAPTPEPTASTTQPLPLDEFIEEAAQPEETPPPAPRPVLLVRKARERGRDWFDDASWLGGLPRLGPVAWPRDEGGAALPFAAQIDLAELSKACPESPLPKSGSLAFFLGTGAVVHVPGSGHDFSEPPRDLPPAFDEDGAPFPLRAGRLTRYFFPFWPISPRPLDIPEALRDPAGADRIAIESAMSVQIARHATPRDHTFFATGVGAPVEALWWHGVIHLADQLHEALDASGEPVRLHREAVERLRREAAALQNDPQAAPYAAEDAREQAEELEEILTELEAQRAALPEMVAALDGFIAEREPWTRLTDEEMAIVADILPEVHERYGELVRHHVPGTLGQMATLSLRTMASGAPDALASLPDDTLARINRAYRLPPEEQHQIFGLAAERPGSPPAKADDMLLLQLGYDDMMEWRWPETGLFQFRIARHEAAAGNWQAARLVFLGL